MDNCKYCDHIGNNICLQHFGDFTIVIELEQYKCRHKYESGHHYTVMVRIISVEKTSEL